MFKKINIKDTANLMKKTDDSVLFYTAYDKEGGTVNPKIFYLVGILYAEIDKEKCKFWFQKEINIKKAEKHLPVIKMCLSGARLSEISKEKDQFMIKLAEEIKTRLYGIIYKIITEKKFNQKKVKIVDIYAIDKNQEIDKTAGVKVPK